MLFLLLPESYTNIQLGALLVSLVDVASFIRERPKPRVEEIANHSRNEPCLLMQPRQNHLSFGHCLEELSRRGYFDFSEAWSEERTLQKLRENRHPLKLIMIPSTATMIKIYKEINAYIHAGLLYFQCNSKKVHNLLMKNS
jgi:hypothetical protein